MSNYSEISNYMTCYITPPTPRTILSTKNGSKGKNNGLELQLNSLFFFSFSMTHAALFHLADNSLARGSDELKLKLEFDLLVPLFFFYSASLPFAKLVA
jgi:hypothetical protein